MTAWSVIVRRDGEAITGAVPCDDWDAAGVLARVVTGWLGGRVSVANAVVDQRIAEQVPTELFEGVG